MIYHKIKNKVDGFLLMSMLILFIFMSIFFGVALRNATFFSDLAIKKQIFITQSYATDALLHYGVAYAQEHYAAIVKELLDKVAYDKKQSAAVIVLLPAWPTVNAYAGVLKIGQNISEDMSESITENSSLLVSAYLYEKDSFSKAGLVLESPSRDTPTMQSSICQLPDSLNAHLLQQLQCIITQHDYRITISCYGNLNVK